MGTMSPEELAQLWRQERLSVDMAIGHITQNLVHLHGALDAHRHVLQASLEQQRHLLSVLHAALPEIPAARRSSPSKKRRAP